jgi:iron complex outermembrane receptor protein
MDIRPADRMGAGCARGSRPEPHRRRLPHPHHTALPDRGGLDFNAEKVVTTEVGYRVQPGARATLSFATFYSRYTEVYSVESQTPGILFPFTIQNGTEGQSWGGEVSGTYQPADGWRLRGGYTLFHKDLWSRPGHNVLEAVLASLGNDPSNVAVLQSMVNLGTHWEWDLVGRYVDVLREPRVPSYIALDARLGFHAGPWALAIAGQNLTDSRHSEFNTTQEVPRSGHAKISAHW